MPARKRPRPTSRPVLPVDPDLAPDDPGEPSRTHVRGGGTRRSAHPAVLAAIFVGGALGSLARYLAELAWPAPLGGVPWATLVINTSGALFLGVVLTLLLEHRAPPPLLRPLLCVGFAGGWTTMSSFALESDLLVHGGHAPIAALYVVLTVLLGVAGTVAGIGAGRRISEREVRRWSSPS